MDLGALQSTWRIPRDVMFRKHDFEKTFQYVLSTKREKIGDNISSVSLRNIMRYTDGSKTWEGTGAGVFGLRTKYSEVTGKFPRIFQKEVHAIDIICARAKLERWYNGQNIAFVFESQAVIQALILLSSGRGWYGSAGRDLTCWQRDSPLGALTQREMKIEKADEFARKGASTHRGTRTFLRPWRCFLEGGTKLNNVNQER